MKKRLAAVLAGLMVLTFGATSAFASISSSASDALEAAGLSNPVEVGTVSGNVTETGTDENGNAYSVLDVTTDVENGTYYVVIDGSAYEVVIEDGVMTIYGYEVEDGEGEDITDLVLYAEGDSTDDTDSSDNSDSSDDTDSDAVSDKTGEFSVLPVLAVAALAGVVVCGKKIKFYA